MNTTDHESVWRDYMTTMVIILMVILLVYWAVTSIFWWPILFGISLCCLLAAVE